MVWFGSPIGLQIREQRKSFKELILEWFHLHPNLQCVRIGATILWKIWKSKNIKISSRILPSVEIVIANAMRMVNENQELALMENNWAP